MIHGPINHWPAVLYLTPVSTAGGVAITAGSLIAVLILHQTNNYNSDSFQFIWNIYANNDVVVPTGGCDVSARDVTVTLPDYPGSMAVPLTVHCAQSQQLGITSPAPPRTAPTRSSPIPPPPRRRRG